MKSIIDLTIRRTILFSATFLLLLFIIPILSMAQSRPVSGIVTDALGNPLANISVTIDGGNSGTTTDEAGHYRLNATRGAKLIFSSVAYESSMVTVGDSTVYNVVLNAKVSSLSDVVVVGYGTQKKVNLVGAVSAVNVDDKITGRALSNISSGLSGLVPGLSATQSSGMAGSDGASLLIRGLGTVNNSDPLIVVDGMPDIDINRIDVNDIQSVSVLKDATSASVYGSRAANGVILITTKSGKGQQKTSINLNVNTALEVPTKAFEFMADYPRALTLEQIRAATTTLPANQIFKNGTIDQWLALGMIDPLQYPNTDWWDIIMRNGVLQNYNLSASGGSDKSNFFGSIGMKNQEGLQIRNDYKQYNARFNFDYKIRSNMNTGFRFSGNWSNLQRALLEGYTDPTPTNTAGFDMQYAIAGITPYDPVSGNYGGVMAYNEDPQAYNPYTVYVNSPVMQNRQEANSNAYIDWSPIEGLTARIDYALSYYNQFQWTANMPNQAFNFQTNSFGSRVYVGPNAGVSNATNTGYKTMLDGRLNYHKTFDINHDVALLFVYSEEYWYDRYQYSSRNDRLYPTLHEIDAALTDIQSTGGNSSAEGLRSYIGRVNYTAYNKYLFEGDFRYDGSSKFLPGSQFGFFPSVALGWRFTEEKFLHGLKDKFLNSGKLRLSYGSLGNNSGVGRYEQQSTLATNNYMIANAITRGFVNSKMVNLALTWENTTVFNLGMDLGFFNNHLSVELDYYNRLTTGMNRPSNMSILLTGAYTAPRTNIGNLRNQGFEGSFAWRDVIGGFNYGVTANISYNFNRLEKWNDFLSRGTTFLDMPYHFLYTYEDVGIAQTWQDVYNATPQGAQPGDILRKDLNGDGLIDGNDLKAYPNVSLDRPSTYFSLNSYGSWKGFDIVVFLQGATGRKNYWLTAFNNVNFGTTRYASTWDHWYNPWSLENRDGAWPRLGGSGNNRAQTTFWLDDMTYLRLKNIQIGYNVPGRLLKRIWASKLRIAFSAENLATITSYRGLDPEKEGNANNLYPINKSYALSIQMSF